MAEADAPRVGSVAEETARLLDALLGGAGSDPARPEPPDDAPDDAPDDPPPAAHHGPHDMSAAADPDSVCHLCPVCQLLRAVRAVRPETVDRLADLAAMLTQSLREVAASRRTEEEEAAPRSRPGPHVEDIQLDDPDPDDPEEPTR